MIKVRRARRGPIARHVELQQVIDDIDCKLLLGAADAIDQRRHAEREQVQQSFAGVLFDQSRQQIGTSRGQGYRPLLALCVDDASSDAC